MTMSFSRKGLGFLATVLTTVVCLVASAMPAFADTTQAAIADPVKRGQVVVFKYDAENFAATAAGDADALPYGGDAHKTGASERWKSIVQGEADLAGTEFTITNCSRNDIDYIDDYGHYTTIAVGESFQIKSRWASLNELREMGIAPDAQAQAAGGAVVAATPANGLPYGTYHIKETKAGAGYGLVTERATTLHPYLFAYMSDTMARWSTEGYYFTIADEGDQVVFSGDKAPQGENGKTKDHPFTSGSTDAPGAFNPVVRGGIEVTKLDHDLDEAYYQGNATLEGAKFAIINYNEAPVRVWSHFVKTADGRQAGAYLKTVQPNEVIGVVQTGTDGTARTFMDALPAGWYKVIELEAPEGYNVEPNWQAFVQITDDDWDSLVTTRCDDPVQRGSLTVHKVDEAALKQAMWQLGEAETPGLADTDKASDEAYKLAEQMGPQGNCTFEGVEYTVYNLSTHDIYRYNEGAEPDAYGVVEGKRIGHADELTDGNASKIAVDTRVIKGDGNTVTFEGLPYGTYVVKETNVPGDTGYKLNGTWDHAFTISSDADNKVAYMSDGDDRTYNTATIVKLNAETGETDPFGAASYEGVTVGLVNRSESWIEYRDQIYQPGERFGCFEYDSELHGFYIEDVPNGTYEVYEFAAGTGNVLNSEWSLILNFTGDQKTTDAGKIFDSLEDESGRNALANYTIREDIRFTKVNFDTQQPMPNVAFKLTSKTTGEWHILVTDENGVVNTAYWLPGDNHDQNGEPQWKPHTESTNASDAAYVDGKIDSSKLTSDQGYWFYGNEAKEGEIFDEFSALPFDTYELEELRCDANKGLELIKRDIVIGRANNNTNELGTLNNQYGDPGEGTVPVAGDLYINAEKTAEPAAASEVEPGSTITYKVAYENTSNVTTTSTIIRDAIPFTTTFESCDNDGVYVEGQGRDRGYVEWVLPGLAPGEKGEVSFTVKVDSNANSILINQARYGSTVEGDEMPTPGDPENQLPIGATNIVRHTTDGTTVPASMYVWKTADPSNTTKLHIGDEVTYTIHFRNDGGTDAFNLGVFDVVPQGTELVQVKDEEGYDIPAITAGGYLVGTYGVAWNIDRVAPGETKDVSFTVRVTKDVYFSVMNQATWGTVKGLVTGCLCNSTNHVVHEVEKLPEVTITKSADKEKTTVTGDIITYTLHIENTGYGNAYGVPVYDYIPADTQYVAGSISSDYTPVEANDDAPYVNWTIPRILHTDGSADVSFKVRVKDKVADGTVIDNVALVGGKVDGGGEPEAPAEEGTDEGGEGFLESMMSFFTGDDSENTESEASADTNIVANGAITSMEQQAESNHVQHVVVNGLDGVEIQKTADPASGEYVAPGQEITYTINWTNKGDENVNGFAVRDVIPEGTKFVPGSIVVTGADNKTSDDVRNENATDEEEKTEAPAEEESVVWTPMEVIGVRDAEGVYKAVIKNPDTQVFRNYEAVRLAIETSKPGDQIEFIVENKGSFDELWRANVQNDGRILLLKRIIVGALDDGSDRVDANGITGNYDANSNAVYALVPLLAPGESGSISFKVTVDEDIAANSVIRNVFTYGKDQYYAPTGDLERSGDHVIELTTGEPGLRGMKSVSPDGPVQAGDILTYTIEVVNDGNAEARNIGVFDHLDTTCVQYVPGTFKVEGGDGDEASAIYAENMTADTADIKAASTTLAPGETLKVTFQVKVLNLEEGKGVVNTASFGDGVDYVDGELPNKTNTTDSTVAMPGLAISKTAEPASGTPVAAGDVIVYNFEVVNNADVDARNVSVYDAVPLNTSYVAGSASDGLVMSDTGALVCENFTIKAHGKRTFSFKVRVNGDVVDHTIISNRATCGISSKALYPLDIDSNEVLHEVVAPKVRLVHTTSPQGGSYVGINDEVTHTITAYNDGSTYARNVGIYDAIPFGEKYVEGSIHGNGTSVSEDGSYVSAMVGDIAPGNSATIIYKTKVTPDAAGEITHQSSWGHLLKDAPTVPQNNAGSSSTVMVTDAKVSLLVSQEPYDGAPVMSGDTITYTVKATNTTGTTISNVGIYDAIPQNTTFVAGSIKTDGVTCDVKRDFSQAAVEGGASWAESVTPEQKAEIEAASPVEAVGGHIATLAAGESASFTFKVTVDKGARGAIINQATWSDQMNSAPTEPCVNVSNDTAAMARSTQLSIVKAQTPGNGSFVTGGDEITYNITVRNIGDVTAKNVGIYDDAPEGTTLVENSLSASAGKVYYGEDGLLAVYAGDLRPGESATMTFKVTVNFGFTGAIHNRALWVSPAATPNLDGIDTSEVQKMAPVAATAAAGVFPATFGKLTRSVLGIERAYALNVDIPEGSDSGWSNDTGDSTDKGDGTSTEHPVVTPDPDEGDDNNGGDEGNQEPAEEPGDNNNGDNTGDTPEVPGTTEPSEGDDLDNIDGGSNSVVAEAVAPAIQLTKSADKADGAQVAAGDEITYTITAENIGEVNGNNIVIRDVIPAGLSLVEGSVISEGCEVAVDGNVLTTIAQIEPGAKAVITFKATVASVDENIVNVAEWGQSTDGTTIPEELPNKSNDWTFPTTSPIELVKSMNVEDGSLVAPGDTITYTIKATNVGDTDRHVAIEDAIPAGTTYVEGSASEGASFADGVLTFDVGTLTPGQSVEVSFSVTVNGAFEPAAEDEGEKGLIDTLADFFTGEGEGAPAPETVDAIHNVANWREVDDNGNIVGDIMGGSDDQGVTVGAPDVSVTKESSVPYGTKLNPGEPVAYTVTINNGGTAAGTVSVTDELPAGLVYAEGTASEGMTFADGKLTGTFTVEAGDKAIITYTCYVADDADGDITNSVSYTVNDVPFEDMPSATIMAAQPDISGTPMGADDNNTKAPFEVSKTANKTQYTKIGDEITYELAVTNNTSAPALGVVVEDTLGYGLTYVSDDAAGSVFGSTNQTVENNAEDTLGSGTYVVNRSVTGAETVDLPTGTYTVGTNGDYTVSITVNEGTPVMFAGYETAQVDLKKGDHMVISVTNQGEEVTDKVVSFAPANTVAAKGTAQSGVRFSIDLSAGETRTVKVVARVNDDATGAVVNNADVYFASTDPVAHDSATVDRAITAEPFSEKLKKAAENLPTTGQDVMLYILLIAGVATVVAGITMTVRSRRKDR